MPNDFSPDFSKLDGDYQVLTELHDEGDSHLYLARNLRLNRDVTISVFRVADGLSAETLAQFASDNRLLGEGRHQHIVPDIDGIWLDSTTFAAVRARVRGATLEQSLAASGPMSIARVASTIRDVADAIAWARDAGVVQRNVAPRDIVFQQGSGRVLLSFEPEKNAGAVARTECDDARTLRRLTIEMLAGEIDRAVSADEIAVPRNISSDLADALAAMRHCTPRSATSSIVALLGALDAAAAISRDEKTQVVSSSSAPAPSGMAIVAEREIPTVVQPSADSSLRPMPVVTSVPRHRKGVHRNRDDAVIVMKPAFGFNARLATAIAVVVVIGGAAIVALNRPSAPTTVASGPTVDTPSSAAGEVALHPVPQSPASVSPPRVASPTIDSVTVKPRAMTPPGPASPPHDSSTKVRRQASADSVTPATKRVVLDSAEEAERQFKRDSAADVADPCLSSASPSQQRCLSEAIERNDRELNRIFARLIAAIRRRSGAAAGDPDPDDVVSLRADQRKWAEARDAECREIGDEPLYAKSRAACYAQKAADRARDLQQRVDALPPAS